MKVKAGVDFNGVRPVVLQAIAIVDEVHLAVFGQDVIVTSAMRPKGNNLSLHPFGLAVDFRDIFAATQATANKALQAEIDKRRAVFMGAVRQRLTKKIGTGFDLLHHDVGQGLHYHLEFDPK